MARLFLDRIDAHNADIARLDTRIQEAMEPFQVARDLLVSIPGFSRIVAEVFIAETGADMTVFPTAGHLASWAGLSPGSNESAGRTKSTKTRPGNRYLKGALGIAAWNLLVNGDFYRDPGPDYYTAHQPTKTRAHAIKQLEALGYKVTLAPLANSA
jgi:transposase